MLVIVANRQDDSAAWLATRWQAHDAVVLTPADLSCIGWRYYVPDSGKSRAVIGGREVSMGEINGVVTRMPAVFERELGHIVPADRPYVAAEMSAFLLAWLSSLNCVMLNRPTPNCLSGPNWNCEQWIHLAARLGIPVGPVHLGTALGLKEPSASGCDVIVVGNQCFGAAAPPLFDHARALAAAAGTGLLAVKFTGPEADGELVSAGLWPDVSSPAVADAMLNYLLRSAC